MRETKYVCFWVLLFPCVCFGFCFEQAGREYAISPVLLETLARVESNLNPNAVNRNGNGSFDIGLMQINSTWFTRLKCREADLLSNPCANVMAGAWVLRHCLDTYGYSWQAVGCYNARSNGKRIDYAWKVFRELKAARPSRVHPAGLSATDSALVFRVHQSPAAVEGRDP